MRHRNHERRETPRRRREDRLEEMLELGSESFRHYRRRARIAFYGLALAAALALFLVQQNTAKTSRVDRVARKANDASARATLAIGRLDKAICAEIHYLERGLTVTAGQPVVNDELKIVLHDLRPLSPGCPPTPPPKLPNPR